LAKSYLREDFASYAKRTEILNNLETFLGRYGIAVADEKIYDRQSLAKIADSIVSFQNIDAGFAIGYIEKDVVGISARSITGVNVQVIMESLGGGGHFNNAAAQLVGVSLTDARNLLIEKIKTIDK